MFLNETYDVDHVSNEFIKFKNNFFCKDDFLAYPYALLASILTSMHPSSSLALSANPCFFACYRYL